jgi:O-antigen/teichoic acid export membrane protein
VNWTSLRANLWEYRKFPLYNTFAALLNTISWQIPTFLLSFFFSTSVVGYYALGSQLLRAPMDLIGGSIGQVFYSHAADARHDGTLAAFVEATFRRLVEYSLFPMLVLTVTGRELFAVLFGPQWAEAGVYTQMLSVWMCFWFISSPMSRLYAVLNRNEMGLALNVVILLSRVASIWLGGMLDSPRAAIGFFSISGVLVYGYLSVSIMVLAGVSWRNTGWILLRNVALFVPAGGVLVVLGTAGVSAWMQVLVAGVFLLCYFMYRLGVRSTVESVKVFLRNVLNSPAHGK